MEKAQVNKKRIGLLTTLKALFKFQKRMREVMKTQRELKKDDSQVLKSDDGYITFDLIHGTFTKKPQIPGIRYNVGGKDEYTVYDGYTKKYYKNK